MVTFFLISFSFPLPSVWHNHISSMDKITRFLVVKITRLFTNTRAYLHQNLLATAWTLDLWITSIPEQAFSVASPLAGIGHLKKSQYNCSTPLGIGKYHYTACVILRNWGIERVKHCSLLLLHLSYVLTYTFKSYCNIDIISFLMGVRKMTDAVDLHIKLYLL